MKNPNKLNNIKRRDIFNHSSHKHKDHFFGKEGEKIAENWLKERGWIIQERNWHAGRHCEIDIIARDPDGYTVFIEVKTRLRPSNLSDTGFALPGLDSIDQRKRKKIFLGARSYLAKVLKKEYVCRFDALVIYFNQTLGQNQQTLPIVMYFSNIFD